MGSFGNQEIWVRSGENVDSEVPEGFLGEFVWLRMGSFVHRKAVLDEIEGEGTSESRG
jgi:hypothetical protein